MLNNSSKSMFSWTGKNLGLIVITASLLAAITIIILLFSHLYQSRLKQIRSQGIELVQLISEIPYYQLVPKKGHRGTLELIKYNESDPNFAYGAIVDKSGSLITSAVISGLIIPKLKPPADPSNWLAEKILRLEEYEKDIIEFHAPLIEKGELLGYVRLGFYAPEYGLTIDQLPFIASILLPIFLIAALFLYLIKREIKSLKQFGQQINNLVNENNIKQVEISASGELSGFIEKFNNFVQLAQSRIAELETNKDNLVASSKLLTYRQSKIESVLHALPEAVLVFDDAGNISFVNSKVSSFLNIPIDVLLKNDISSWNAESNVVKYILKIKNNPISSYPAERIEFTPENSPDKRIAIKAYPLFSPKEIKHVYGTLVLFQDVSEENLAKQARGEFVAHVAHELKTPLNVLAMYSETLQREEGQTVEFRTEAVNVIRDEVERISMLINNLLSITKIELGSLSLIRQHVKLRDLLLDIFETTKRSVQTKNLEFKLDIPKEMSPLYIDKDLLRIAINNLLTNAIKYSKECGVVLLSAEEINGSVNIRVRDTGIGISKDDQNHIFDKFYRSNDENVRVRTGHGLGLSLTKDIVQLHHGSLKVQSNLGEGSEFTIVLEDNSSLLEMAV
jgi:signal transduction histidine kinase